MKKREFLHKIPRRYSRWLLTIACIILYFYLFAGNTEKVTEIPKVRLEMQKYTEPNQTRWLELFKMPPKMINLTSPLISPTVKMIVIVPIEPHMDERRAEIRDSWANGTNSHAIRDGLISVIFVVYSDNFTQQQIKEENKKYRDILMIRGKETYKGLVYKLLLVYKWITKNYPLADVAKIDSDVVVDLDRLYRAVNKQVHYHRFVMGFLWKDVKAHRDPYDPWYIPSSSYSAEILPTYVNGPLYVFSASALKAILLEAPHYRVFEVEDALFTGTLAEAASVKRIFLNGVLNKVPEIQLCIDEKPTIIAYPIHDLKIGIRLEYEKMKTIRCMTFWESLFS